MKFEIKISKKPVEYHKAIKFLENRLIELKNKKKSELIWILEHPSTYTAGITSKKNEILDKNIKIIYTNRGGKITWHGPGQKICYFVIDIAKRGKDIREFIRLIENSIINTLKEYKIKSFADRENVGIWVLHKNKRKKISAIGIKIKKWIAYHGFSININNSLLHYKNIIPCGISDKEVTNMISLKKEKFKGFDNKLIYNLTKNLMN